MQFGSSPFHTFKQDANSNGNSIPFFNVHIPDTQTAFCTNKRTIITGSHKAKFWHTFSPTSSETITPLSPPQQNNTRKLRHKSNTKTGSTNQPMRETTRTAMSQSQRHPLQTSKTANIFHKQQLSRCANKQTTHIYMVW
jgi:hypothetical protein